MPPETSERPPVPTFELVVNNGKSKIDSATLPVRCFLSPKVIAMAPTHIIFCIQRPDELDDCSKGERHLFKLADGMTWLTFDRSGPHRIRAIAFNQTHFKERNDSFELKDFLKHNGPRKFKYSHIFEQNSKLEFSEAIVDVDIPPGFFAQKPKSWLGQKFWNWVNWGYEWSAPNSCIYKGRILPAITLKPFLWLGLQILKLLCGPALAMLALVVRAVVFVLGFRPNPFIADIWHLICIGFRDYNYKDEKRPDLGNAPFYPWRQWQMRKWELENRRGGWESCNKTFIPPIVWVAVPLGIYGFYLAQSGPTVMAALLMIVGAIGVIMAMKIVGEIWENFSQKLSSKQAERLAMDELRKRTSKELEQELIEAKQRAYLTEEFLSTQKPADLSQAPKVPPLRRLTMTLESWKARACKPFEK